MNLNVDIDTQSLAFSIAHEMDYDDILQFFKDIEGQIADWDFTESCAEYFNFEMEKRGK